MGKFKPNEDQKLFLDTNDCNVLVSASAGSGKTSTMIQKLLLLLDKYRFPISSLLVVTFTNAAAAEIRQRLYIAISEYLANVTSPEDRAYFQKQLENIGNAEIGTLHAICKKLIVKYFYVIEQSPDFTLITEREADYLFDSAMEVVFKRHITNKDNEFFELYNSYNASRNNSVLRQMIKSLYDFGGSKPDYIEWREQTKESSYELDLDKNSACLYIIENYKKIFGLYLKIFKNLKNEAKQLNLDKHYNFICVWEQFLDEFISTTSFSMALKVYNNFVAPRKPTKLKNAIVEEEMFEDTLYNHRDMLKVQMNNMEKDLISTDYDTIRDSIANAKKNLERILNLTDEVGVEFSTLKKDKNALDFNDLEFLMLKILEDDAVREELKSHYRFIFFDEYQDINEKQEMILSKLTSGDNYYMIGDVKQSIYAFRQASPKIFIAKFQKFIDDGKANKLITFNKNYRSEKNILAYANQVFDKLITEKTIGINYKKTARFESEKTLAVGRVKLNILDTTNCVNNRVDAEAMLVADEIVSLMQKKKADGTAFDYKDIAIILRSRGELAHSLYNTLSGLQIPVKLEIDTEYFETNEIKAIISILKVLSNYRDDLSVATTLKLLFGLTEDELLTIREVSGQKFYYEAVLEYNANDNIMTKLVQFFEFIKYYKKYMSLHTLAETIWDILERYNVLVYYKSLPNGIERENNILEFVSFADNENFEYSLDKFLEYIEFASTKNLKQTIGTKGNAVEICTIHHSKGLEYPAVILCGLGRQIRTNKDSSNIVINNRFGLGLKSVDSEERVVGDTIIRAACKLENKKSEYDEEIRLLYVAMTRPREYLTMIGSYALSQLEFNHKDDIYSSVSLLDMILKTYSSSDIGALLNSKNRSLIINRGNANESAISIYAVDDIVTTSQRVTNEVILSKGNKTLVDTLKNIYADRPSSETFTIKNTVTNILREEVDYENLVSIPNKLNVSDKVESVDSLKLGTAYHLIMQKLNFNESTEDIELLIDALINEGLIAKELKSYIKVDEIVEACKTVGELVVKAKNVYKEKQFLMQENYDKLVKNSDNKTKVVVQGVIDLALEMEDGAILIDYKTNKTTNAQMLKDEYSLQLDIYKRAFELATGIKITKKYIYSFYQKRLIEVS